MKNLTGKQKTILNEYSKAYMFYIRENVMLKGSESEEIANRSNSARTHRLQMQIAITAMCEILDIKYTLDNLYDKYYTLNFWDKKGSNLLFTVKEIQ